MNWSEVHVNATACTDFGDWGICKMTVECMLKVEEEIILTCKQRYSRKIYTAFCLGASSKSLQLPLNHLCYHGGRSVCPRLIAVLIYSVLGRFCSTHRSLLMKRLGDKPWPCTSSESDLCVF